MGYAPLGDQMIAIAAGLFAALSVAAPNAELTFAVAYRRTGECRRVVAAGPASARLAMEPVIPEGFTHFHGTCVDLAGASLPTAGCSIRIDRNGWRGQERRVVFLSTMVAETVRECRRAGGESQVY